MRRHPHLLEINTATFLKRLSDLHEKNFTLSQIPDDIWLEFKRDGFDIIWLMGVWQRSPGARKEALQNQDLRKVYADTLPDWSEKDVDGSPYAIYSYTLDSSFGKPEELNLLHQKLNDMGMKLFLDFVPNHLAYDHPWTSAHADYFVMANKEQAGEHPDWFFKTPEGFNLAHGRDPNFSPWSDTVQVNYFAQDLRTAWINQLLEISKVCDGVRCDMAMLAINRIFQQTWGPYLTDHLLIPDEFWSYVIGEIKKERRDFIFLAEAYWDLERELQEMGFDYTYDKAFYDRLAHYGASHIKEHLKAPLSYQEKSAHFIENHDESRVHHVLGKERSLAAAVILATVPGLRFFYEGQMEGRKIRVPVQLKREPAEEKDAEIAVFYEQLFLIINQNIFHDGQWKTLEVRAAVDFNQTHTHLLAWLWQYEKGFKLVIVNYSSFAAQGKVMLPAIFTEPEIQLDDELNGERYQRSVAEILSAGLFVDLKPWKAHVFGFQLARVKSV